VPATSARNAAPSPAPAGRNPIWLWAAALGGLTVVVYLPVLRAGWVWDDDDYVTANQALRSLHGLWQLWAEPGIVPQYYPVTFTSLWIEYQVWGPWAPGFHATNVCLHAANAVLAWRLLDRLRVPGAWIAAVLFAVHPVHVESVAWVTERKNVLSALFALAAALVFVTRVVDGDGAGRRRAVSAVVVLFALSLLSKSVTATLPMVLAVALWGRDGRVRRRDAVVLAPLLGLGLAAGALTAWMERTRVGAVGPYWSQTVAERVLIAGRALWFYVGKLLWPDPVTFNYERWTIDVHDPLAWAWPLAALTAAGLAWGLRGRIGRGPAAGLAAFAITLAPALGFVNVYPMRYAYVADHFQYLASLGVLALVGAGIARVATGRAAVAAVAPLAVALALLTARQSLAYADVETLWRDTLAKNPRSVLALQNLGTLEYGRAQREGASHLALALGLYRRARDVEPAQPDVWNSIGIVEAQMGRREDAAASFETALRYDPRHAEAARNLGSVLAALGSRDDAIAAYERAIALAPAMVEAREDLAVILLHADRAPDAERLIREAIRLAPDSARARLQLGAALAAQGRAPEAIGAYEAATRMAPRSVDVHAALAEALAAVGERDRAIAAAERARDLAASEGRASTVAELERRLTAYRAAAPPALE
jgi:tetratricopeptide (TPR) repeat protein